MKPRSTHRRGARQGPPVDPVAALRDYAIKLHDEGDGHGVDWARVAEAYCRVAVSCLRELPPDDQGRHSVARRAHDAAYSLVLNVPDSGMAYRADRPDAARTAEEPAFTPHPAQSPE